MGEKNAIWGLKWWFKAGGRFGVKNEDLGGFIWGWGVFWGAGGVGVQGYPPQLIGQNFGSKHCKFGTGKGDLRLGEVLG